jgi:hypothetical protein
MCAMIRQGLSYTVVFLLIAVILGFFSCANSRQKANSVVYPEDDYARKAHELQWLQAGRGPLGCFNVTVPASGGRATVAQARSGDFHVDITDFLMPPFCMDCLLVGNFYPIYGGLAAAITIRNPLPAGICINPYDVRLVVLTPWQVEFPSGRVSASVMNPDGYTGLYRSAKYMSSIHPYLNYGSTADGFSIPAGESYTRELRLYSEVDYVEFQIIIDVSWMPPGSIEPDDPTGCAHCREAFSIGVTLAESPDPEEYAFAVYVDVYDWQNDEACVAVEAPSLTSQRVELQYAENKDYNVASFFGYVNAEFEAITPDNPVLVQVIDPFTRMNGTHPVAYQFVWFNNG